MSRTLLCIDPDPDVRLLVRKALAPAGYTVVDAGTVAAGREVAEQARPDVVLVDFDSGRSEATELTRALRQSQATATALLLASTAEDRPEHLRTTAGCGFDGVFVKPLDIDALLERLPPVSRPPMPARVVHAEPPIHVSGLRRRTLATLTAEIVRRVSIADALLALFTSDGEAVTVVAGHSARPGVEMPAIGQTIPLGAVAWLRSALDGREPAVLDPEPIHPSPLLPAGTTSVLVVPIATKETLYGVLVLGERRRRAFPPAQVAEGVREGSRLAAILGEFDLLDATIDEARRGIARFRVEATRRLVAGARRQPPAPDGVRDAIVHASVVTAARLGLSETDCDLVRHAVELHDVGTAWIAGALLPHMDVPAADQQAVLSLHGDQTREMLQALDWPPAVLGLLVTDGAGRSRKPDVALAGRVVAVAIAYHGLVAPTAPGEKPLGRKEALARLARETDRLAPDVVEAFADVLGSESASWSVGAPARS